MLLTKEEKPLHWHFQLPDSAALMVFGAKYSTEVAIFKANIPYLGKKQLLVIYGLVLLCVQGYLLHVMGLSYRLYLLSDIFLLCLIPPAAWLYVTVSLAAFFCRVHFSAFRREALIFRNHSSHTLH